MLDTGAQGSNCNREKVTDDAKDRLMIIIEALEVCELEAAYLVM